MISSGMIAVTRIRALRPGFAASRCFAAPCSKITPGQCVIAHRRKIPLGRLVRGWDGAFNIFYPGILDALSPTSSEGPDWSFILSISSGCLVMRTAFAHPSSPLAGCGATMIWPCESPNFRSAGMRTRSTFLGQCALSMAGWNSWWNL